MAVDKLNLILLLIALFASSAQAVGFLQVEKKEYTSSSTVEEHNRPLEQFHEAVMERGLIDSCGENFNLFECLADGQYVVSCGNGLKRNEENFCVDLDGDDICCGDDCCSFTAGAIAGGTIGALFVITLIVLASCACCSCCPLHSKLCCAKRNAAS